MLRRLAFVFVCFVAGVRALAADQTKVQGILDEAEHVRASDKVKARRLLDEVERDAGAQADPTLVARMQWLECKWADAPAAAYRAASLN